MMRRPRYPFTVERRAAREVAHSPAPAAVLVEPVTPSKPRAPKKRVTKKVKP